METVLEKLTNLYVAAHGCEVAPDLLMLCIWALDGDPVDTKWFDANRSFDRIRGAGRQAAGIVEASC